MSSVPGGTELIRRVAPVGTTGANRPAGGPTEGLPALRPGRREAFDGWLGPNAPVFVRTEEPRRRRLRPSHPVVVRRGKLETFGPDDDGGWSARYVVPIAPAHRGKEREWGRRVEA